MEVVVQKERRLETERSHKYIYIYHLINMLGLFFFIFFCIYTS